MKERPILFSAPMVRAILDGSKTQTRRVMKPQPARIGDTTVLEWRGGLFQPERLPTNSNMLNHCPYGQPGDRLWVRETWCSADILFQGYECYPPQVIGYRADHSARVDGSNPIGTHGWNWQHDSVKWKPSIHMPRWASRILLEIVSVRVERLNAISDAECWAEGIEACDGLLDDMAIIRLAKSMGRCMEDAAPTYAALWESINGAGSWDANPWVWVVEFKRVTP